MARYYDKVLNGKFCRSEDEPDLRKATVVVADQSTEYYYALNDKEYWHLTDFPNLAPPLANFFIETIRPSKIISKVWGERAWFEPASADMLRFEGMAEDRIVKYMARCKEDGNIDRRRPLAWGLHLRTIPISELKKWTHGFIYPEIEMMDVKWAMRGVLYVDWKTPNVSGPVWELSVGLKADGSVAASSISDGAAVGVDGPSSEYLDLIESRYEWLHERTDLIKALRSEMMNHINPLLMAISFMHCKNVQLVSESPPPKLAKRSRERGRPLCSYKVVDIIPLKEILRRNGVPEETGIKKALHLCRGHFKTYTAEKPLMGRAVGSFFWPQHLRGNKKHGIVVKDYRIGSEGGRDTKDRDRS